MTSHERPAREGSAAGRPPTRLAQDTQGIQEASARWAVSILRGAKPYQLPAGRLERVWSNLQSVAPARRPSRLRIACAVALCLVAGVFASAAFAQWPGWLARAIHGAPNEAGAGRAARPTSIAPTPRPTSAAMPPPATPPAETPSPPAAAAVASSGAGHARRLPPNATPEESEALLGAMRALRIEHNPTRARAILNNYLVHHPKSELAEEALVMLIEAAAAHGDRDAPALAARYFSLYPKGEFTAQVRRTLSALPLGAK